MRRVFLYTVGLLAIWDEFFCLNRRSSFLRADEAIEDPRSLHKRRAFSSRRFQYVVLIVGSAFSAVLFSLGMTTVDISRAKRK